MVPIYMGIVKMGLGSTLRSVLFWTSTVDVFVRMIPVVAVIKIKFSSIDAHISACPLPHTKEVSTLLRASCRGAYAFVWNGGPRTAVT